MEALTDYAIQADARAGMFDALASVGQMEASIAAFKARLIAEIVAHAEMTEAVEFRDRVLRSEVATTLHIPESTAGALIVTSQMLVADLPATMTALEAGTISWRHVERMVDHAQSLPADARAAFESVVLPVAARVTPAQFDKQARRVRERMHPESLTVRRITAVELRSVGVEPGRDGMAWLTAHLPADDAIAIVDRVDDIARGLHTEEETRTRTQLRADVFTDLLINAHPTQGGNVIAQVTITVPALTLLGRSDEPAELEGYGPISIEVARELCANAPSFSRILTHPVTGAILTLDRTSYRPSKDLRRWLRLRDGYCRFPGCGRKARTADIDHTTPWHDGGTTEPDNLECLCPNHHRLKHNSGWTVTQVGDGILHWVSPSGRIYETRPQI